MKLTNIQIKQSLNSLGSLMSQPLPVTLSFKLKKLKKLIVPILEIVDEELKSINTTHQSLKEDGTPEVAMDNQGKPLEGYIVLTKAGIEATQKLLEVTNEVEFEQIKISDLPDSIKLTTYDLEVLEWLISE